ncbi:MAG: hypothetical protein KKA32_05020 [Actinobacteria bacterium]|nr:hypothetical protein [Actinomycetota bacterium]
MSVRRRIVVTVKTYPNPSTTYEETVCIAGYDLDLQQFVRLYPVRFRDLPYPRWFKKWEVIEADVTKKAADPRGDTYTPDPATISKVDGYYKGNGSRRADWSRRDALVLPLASTLENLAIQADRFEGS